MNENMVTEWVNACVKAWESNSPEDIGELFTDDAIYLTAPHREQSKDHSLCKRTSDSE